MGHLLFYILLSVCHVFSFCLQWNKDTFMALAEDDDLHVGQHHQLHRHLRAAQHCWSQTGQTYCRLPVHFLIHSVFYVCPQCVELIFDLFPTGRDPEQDDKEVWAGCDGLRQRATHPGTGRAKWRRGWRPCWISCNQLVNISFFFVDICYQYQFSDWIQVILHSVFGYYRGWFAALTGKKAS